MAEPVARDAAASRRLAVLGKPIAHSKSPELHAAAYRVLGLPWRYEAIELAPEGLAGFLAGLDDSWRGLSLTMPHKQLVVPLLHEADTLTELTGAANTVLLDDGRLLGFNTDVAGIVGALREVGAGRVENAVVLGSGATAASALAASAQLGARRVTVLARSRERAETLAPLAERLGMALGLGALGDSAKLHEDYDAVVSTLPPGVADGLSFPLRLRRNAALLDVAYADGQTWLARHWTEVDGVTAPGLLMLYYQAVEQVRIFVADGGALPREGQVRAAMRASVGQDYFVSPSARSITGRSGASFPGPRPV